jgi:hypothetical protein
MGPATRDTRHTHSMEGDPKNIKGAARITALNVSRPEVWGRPYILK